MLKQYFCHLRCVLLFSQPNESIIIYDHVTKVLRILIIANDLLKFIRNKVIYQMTSEVLTYIETSYLGLVVQLVDSKSRLCLRSLRAVWPALWLNDVGLHAVTETVTELLIDRVARKKFTPCLTHHAALIIQINNRVPLSFLTVPDTTYIYM